MHVFIVGTHSFLFSVTVDQNFEPIDVKMLDKGHHYGISTNYGISGADFVSKSNDMELKIYDKSTLELKERVSLSGDFGEVHQIVSANGGIYFANTKFNCLTYLNDDLETRVDYHLEEQDTDVNHINSIFVSGDHVLVLLHNRGKKPTEMALLEHADGRIKLMHTIPLFDDKGAHNIYVENNYLFYNASYSGEFVVVDLLRHKVIKRLKFGGHTKGLSVMKDYFVIGFSDHAAAKDRNKSNGNMAIIDKQSFETVKTIDLNEMAKAPVGNVNEIRCLSEHDFSEAYNMRMNVNWNRIKAINRYPRLMTAILKLLRL